MDSTMQEAELLVSGIFQHGAAVHAGGALGLRREHPENERQQAQQVTTNDNTMSPVSGIHTAGRTRDETLPARP
ncbi:hypothetical protein ACFXPN_47050 [Streptomyces griseorubiginosus]|uniref:hypothetical protein n=1 Tax=Streptomyces griseorubiginosus TaxID=67304 RepID=UPI003683B685